MHHLRCPPLATNKKHRLLRRLGFYPRGRFAQAVPFGLEEYLELADTMGRAVHPHKRGSITPHTPAVLQRLGMDAEAFICAADVFFSSFTSAVGTPANLLQWAIRRLLPAARHARHGRRAPGV